MMQRMIATQRINMISRRCFASYNYTAASNSKVFLGVSKDGQEAGKLVFELYDNHSPALAFNFATLASGPLVGTSLTKAMPGYGVQVGVTEDTERLADENLELRHHKRGMLSMVNEGSHSNGSNFVVTFGEATYLDGYQSIVGEMVQGEDLLAKIEADSSRCGALGSEWKISSAGEQH